MRTVEVVQVRLDIDPPPVLFDPPNNEEVAKIRTWLAHASRCLHGPSHHQPTILQDEGVKDTVYIVTIWPNVEAHTAYTKTEDRNQLVEQVNHIGTLERIALYDVEHANHIPVKANVLAVTRINVDSRDCEAFEKEHDKVKQDLEKFSHFPVAAGWLVKEYSIEKNGDFAEVPLENKGNGSDRREYIVFSGYESVERRLEFSSADPKRFERYAGAIKPFMHWFERRNARVIDIK